MPYPAVIQMFEANAAMQARGNITLGPIFRAACDAFREWGKAAECGWRFEAPELQLMIVRLSRVSPAGWLSETAQKRMKAAAEEQPDPNDRPKLVVP